MWVFNFLKMEFLKLKKYDCNLIECYILWFREIWKLLKEENETRLSSWCWIILNEVNHFLISPFNSELILSTLKSFDFRTHCKWHLILLWLMRSLNLGVLIGSKQWIKFEWKFKDVVQFSGVSFKLP